MYYFQVDQNSSNKMSIANACLLLFIKLIATIVQNFRVLIKFLPFVIMKLVKAVVITFFIGLCKSETSFCKSTTKQRKSTK